MILIKNGLVKTMAGPDIENGQVLIDGKKIVAVGKTVDAPADAEVVDATGCIVTPGFVEAHCHIGLHEEIIGAVGNDVNENTDPVTPQMRAIDAINPMDEAFDLAVAAGVTTGVTGPGSANVIGGTFCAIKLHGRRVDDMIVKNPVAMKCAMGENPKRVYGGAKKSPATRMAIASIFRDTLRKAQKYTDELDAYEADPEKNKRPNYDVKMEAMVPVMRHEIPMKCHCHRADDILTAIRIAKEFGVDMTLDHCTDGAVIADYLGECGFPGLLGPSLGSKGKHEVAKKGFETVPILAHAGMKFCIITDAPVCPLRYLPLCAGLAIKAGLEKEEAWKAITIYPAEITGIADRVGSLEPGKDADVVIFRGNPLEEIAAKTVATYINGEVVYHE